MTDKKVTFIIDATDNATSKLKSIESSVKSLSKAYDDAGSAFSKVGSRFSTELGLLKSAAGYAAEGILALGAAFTTAGIFAIKSAASYEQTRVSFEAMLGSAEKAKELMKEVSDFAAKTPFQVPEVVTAGKQLLAFGVPAKDMISKLTLIGDAASKMDVPMNQAIDVWAKAKAGMFEIREFAPLGVTRESLEQYGVTFTKTGETVDRSKLLPALEKMWGSAGTVGMMDKQSKTFSGTISNLMDDIGRFARSVVGIEDTGDIREGSIFAKLKDAASGLLVWLDANKEKITADIQGFIDRSMQKGKEWIDQMGGPQGIIQKFKDFWNTLTTQVIPAIGNLVATIVPVIKFVADHAKGIMDLIIAYEGIKIILTTGQVIQAIMNFSAAIMASGGANVAVTTLTSSVGSMAGAGLAGALGLGLVAAFAAVSAILVTKAIGSVMDMNKAVDDLRIATDKNRDANQQLQEKINLMNPGPYRDKMQQLHDSNMQGIEDAEKLADRYSGLGGVINSVIDKIDEVFKKASKADDKGIMVFGRYATGGIVPGFNTGGIAYAASGMLARGTDTVPAMLTPGEMVLNKGQQNNLFNMLNGRGSSGGSTFNFTFNGDISDKGQLITQIKQAINRELELSRYGIG